MATRRTVEAKNAIIAEVKSGKSVAEVAKANHVAPSLIYSWMRGGKTFAHGAKRTTTGRRTIAKPVALTRGKLTASANLTRVREAIDTLTAAGLI